MRHLTIQEVKDNHGGILPPDATLRGGAESPPQKPLAKPPPRTGQFDRFAVLNAFADFDLEVLTGSETKVWLILYRDTKRNGIARTGQADIARRAGLSIRTVKRTVSDLQTKGVLSVAIRGKLNGGPSSYRVHPKATARVSKKR